MVASDPGSDDAVMVKRTIIAGMWFVALSSLGSVMSAFLDVPADAMLIPTVAGSLAVWFGLAGYESWRATELKRMPQVDPSGQSRLQATSSLQP